MGMRPSATQHSDVRFANQLRSAVEPIEYKKFEGYLDNLAHAATNKKAVLQKLTASVALLFSTNATIVAKIKALTTDNKYLGGLARSATTSHPRKGKGKGRWTKANPGCFIVGGYCHTHGFCVGKYHDSSSCSIPGPQQKWEATRVNPMGVCKDLSGWDA